VKYGVQTTDLRGQRECTRQFVRMDGRHGMSGTELAACMAGGDGLYRCHAGFWAQQGARHEILMSLRRLFGDGGWGHKRASAVNHLAASLLSDVVDLPADT
jgi:hypothetical protein